MDWNDYLQASNAILKVEVINLLINNCDSNGGKYSKQNLIDLKGYFEEIVKENVKEDECFKEALQKVLKGEDYEQDDDKYKFKKGGSK